MLASAKTSKEKYFNMRIDYTATINDLVIFDQSGYSLTPPESVFARDHGYGLWHHTPNIKAMWYSVHPALRYPWFYPSGFITEGVHVNHCNLFERKGFSEDAYNQVKEWCDECPLFYKLLKLRPKWGLDFSLDYCDKDGNVFEVVHWEWDTFDYNEHIEKKEYYEEKFLKIDWNSGAKYLLANKDKWHSLNFVEQSKFKCEYFGIEKEQFKMVPWE